MKEKSMSSNKWIKSGLLKVSNPLFIHLFDDILFSFIPLMR
jgi:hypothetical protein